MPRTSSISYRGSNIIVEYAADGATVSCIYLEGTGQTFSSVDAAKRSIDAKLDLPPPEALPVVPPPRPRMRR